MRDYIDVEKDIEAGIVWLREEMARAGKQRVVMGLSGGLDSAVVALWATRALGAENVIMIRMPKIGTSPLASLSDANKVTEITGAMEITIPILSLVEDFRDKFAHAGYDIPLGHMAHSNLAPRVRAVILRTAANLLDALVLGTENKTERMLGYFTLGGDEESDIELLSDFYKYEVRSLGKALGVPQEIIEKAPSAELWPGQTDEDELGFTYTEADTVLERDELGHLLPATFNPAAADAVRLRVSTTSYKRAEKPTFMRGQ